MPTNHPPKALPEAIRLIQVNRDNINRLCNELNRVHLRWAIIMRELEKGCTLESALFLIKTLSSETHQKYLEGISMLEEGIPLEEVLSRIGASND
jgi:hypothetical protein